jgi:hypothetical protein
MFDKEEYWKNRSAGLRGQGKLQTKVIRDISKENFIQSGSRMARTEAGFIIVNRKQDRQRQPDRTGSKPNRGYRHRELLANKKKEASNAPAA